MDVSALTEAIEAYAAACGRKQDAKWRGWGTTEALLDVEKTRKRVYDELLNLTREPRGTQIGDHNQQINHF